MQKAEIEKAYEDQKHFWALIKKYTPRNLSTDSISAKQWHDYHKELLTQASNQKEANRQILQSLWHHT